jgi:pimeloyl-ACP methyl ester carboxylesterase
MGDEKYTFVVVHGATAGGWEWKPTGKFLTDDGHTVYRATLTGLGEREHLNSTDVDLQTHINDVVNLILYEDLHDVVLTGHSYGGMVITGVIDRIPERIKHVVFLDAAVPDDGMSLWDLFGGTGPQDPERFKDGFMQVPWVKPGTPPPHSVKQSIKCFNQPVSYKNPAAKALPVTYVAFLLFATDGVAGVTLALPDAALLLVAEGEAGDLDVRNGDRHEVFPFPTHHLALRDVPPQVLSNLAPHDVAEPRVILVNL